MFFHIIILDFTIELLNYEESAYNYLLIMTCKFFKQILLLLGRNDYNGEQWVKLVIDRLLVTNWDISKI